MLNLFVLAGLSSTCHVVTGLSHLSGKKHQDAKKTVSKLVEKNFPAEKLHSLDTPQVRHHL